MLLQMLSLYQGADDSAPDHSAMAGDEDALSGEKAHADLFADVLTAHFARQHLDVGVSHNPDQLGKRVFGCPSKLFPGFRSVANQQIDFGRAVILRIDLDVFFPIQTAC